MWSYECIFEHRDMNKKRTRNSVPLTQTSICIVAETGEQVLNYAIEELKRFETYELIAVIRRNAIARILP